MLRNSASGYSLNRWTALTTYLLDGNVPIDNNHIENLMRPWAMGRKAWLFAGSELAGQRAAVIMSLVQSAKMSGHDPWAYLKDVLTRLPKECWPRIAQIKEKFGGLRFYVNGQLSDGLRELILKTEAGGDTPTATIARV